MARGGPGSGWPHRVFLPPRWWFSPFTVDQSQLRGAPCDTRSPLAAPARTPTPEICGSEACVHVRNECPRGSDTDPAVCLPTRPPLPSLGLQLPVSSTSGLKRPVWQPMATRGWWLTRCRESL